MRVISGACKGRRLKSGRGAALRPTSDKVREAVFDLLQAEMEGRRALDLFAGTGAMGIEALSRGAAHAVFVDFHRAALSLIRQNLATCGLEKQAEIHKLTLPGQLKALAGSQRPELVFIDPPYGKGLAGGTIGQLDELNLVAPGGMVVVEQSAGEELDNKSYKLIKRKTYSTTTITILERA